MNELGRLLRYAKPYSGTLALSVVLMAAAGAAHAAIALLIQPIFDRVLDPASPEAPVRLVTLFGRSIYLQDLVPASIHNVWTMVAAAVLAVFLVKGLSEYAGNYLVNYAGFSAVNDLRLSIFRRLLNMDSEFFELHSTGRLMSSIMNDIEKIQVAVSHMLADWLRQTFAAAGLLFVVLRTDWKLALASLTLLPFVLVPTARIGKRIRRATRKAQDHAADLNQILQETLSGHPVVKSFSAEEHESRRFQEQSAR
jgi:subfamily B ATP-binding cassette protein MsbA